MSNVLCNILNFFNYFEEFSKVFKDRNKNCDIKKVSKTFEKKKRKDDFSSRFYYVYNQVDSTHIVMGPQLFY